MQVPGRDFRKRGKQTLYYRSKDISLILYIFGYFVSSVVIVYCMQSSNYLGNIHKMNGEIDILSDLI